MAIQQLELVKVNGSNKIFGGFIYNINYTIGVNGESTKIQIDVISESGEYIIDESAISMSTIYKVQIGTTIEVAVSLIKYRKESNPSSKTLSLFFEGGEIILDKILVLLKNIRGNPPGHIIIGDLRLTREQQERLAWLNYSFQAESSKTALAKLNQNLNFGIPVTPPQHLAGSIAPTAQIITDNRTLELVCNLSEIETSYNFNQLIDAIKAQGVIKVAEAPNGDSKDFQSFEGAITEVLQEWCQLYGWSFYWENGELHVIDLSTPLLINTGTLPECKTSTNEEVSAESTYGVFQSAIAPSVCLPEGAGVVYNVKASMALNVNGDDAVAIFKIGGEDAVYKAALANRIKIPGLVSQFYYGMHEFTEDISGIPAEIDQFGYYALVTHKDEGEIAKYMQELSIKADGYCNYYLGPIVTWGEFKNIEWTSDLAPEWRKATGANIINNSNDSLNRFFGGGGAGGNFFNQNFDVWKKQKDNLDIVSDSDNGYLVIIQEAQLNPGENFEKSVNAIQNVPDENGVKISYGYQQIPESADAQEGDFEAMRQGIINGIIEVWGIVKDVSLNFSTNIPDDQFLLRATGLLKYYNIAISPQTVIYKSLNFDKARKIRFDNYIFGDDELEELQMPYYYYPLPIPSLTLNGTFDQVFTLRYAYAPNNSHQITDLTSIFNAGNILGQKVLDNAFSAKINKSFNFNNSKSFTYEFPFLFIPTTNKIKDGFKSLSIEVSDNGISTSINFSNAHFYEIPLLRRYINNKKFLLKI